MRMLEGPTENVVPLDLKHAGEGMTMKERLFFLKTLLAALKAAAFQMPCLAADCGQLQAHLML